MNRRQLIPLLVLGLIVGGAGLAVYERNSSTWEGASSSGKVLGDFPINNVARVVIRNGASTLTLEKKNDAWVVHERGDYPADFSRVGDFIEGLWNLKPVQDVQAGPSQLGRLGLQYPGSATLIDLQDSNSQRIAALLAGKNFLKQSPDFPGAMGFPAGRYVMIADSTPPKISLVSELLDQADTNPASWLDKSFVKIARIQSVALTNGSTAWKLSRDGDNSPDWKLADLKPGEKVDSARVPQFAAILGAPMFTDVRTGGAIDGDSAVTVETFDHLTYTLKFGKPDGAGVPMMVAVAANAPKDEKPADKKRAEDALAKAKNFEGRVYLVPDSVFSPLLKSRADLLAAAPAVKPSAAPAVQRAGPVTVTTPPVSVRMSSQSPAK
jgi:hypothetical protein